MSHRTKALLLLLLLAPRWACAHGEEVLTTVLLLAGSLLLFLVLVLLSRIPYAEQAIVTTVYLLTMGLVLYWTTGLPYRLNRTLISMVIGGAPVLTTGAAYLVLWTSRKKRAQRDSSGNYHSVTFSE